MRTPVIILVLTITNASVNAESVSLLPVQQVNRLPARIAFGSCANQTKPQPVLTTALLRKPEIFVYLGDNIYGDTRNMSELRDKYAALHAKPEFQALRKNVTLLSIWDDHDYGENDAGREYPQKEESREIFLDFWKVPQTSPRRKRLGIYGAHRFVKADRALQIILLDTRTFRDSLRANPDPLPINSKFKNDYQPSNDPSKSILGEDQWNWLEAQFREPADLRIVSTSIQFCHEYNGWESWNNLPREQKRMFDLIRKTRANGVIFLSGDVHWGEISMRKLPSTYPLYDITASGITEEWEKVEPNRFRIAGTAVQDNHFGLISIDWQPADPTLSMQIIDRNGKVRLSHSVKLSELRF